MQCVLCIVLGVLNLSGFPTGGVNPQVACGPFISIPVQSCIYVVALVILSVESMVGSIVAVTGKHCSASQHQR